jgi:lactoylglutathione lyase
LVHEGIFCFTQLVFLQRLRYITFLNVTKTQEAYQMKFRMIHNNLNVFDLDKSIKFYQDAFDMHEVRRINAKDGSFIIVYLEDGNSSHQLELTWLREMDRPYDLGDNEFHLAFEADDYEAAHKRHEEMDIICFENKEMGIYFVTDPNGYWLEILPEKL